MPSLPTGLASADARDDFLRARRRQTLTRIGRSLSWARGDVDLILPFDEVVEALGRVGESHVGLRTIELDSVVGSVDPRRGFDRSFRPTTSRVRTRWERIAEATRRGDAMPPITVYRVGEAHFVRDGHHRVSVARALGRRDIDALVTEVRTRVGAERALRVDDLPMKGHERVFAERVPLAAADLQRVRPSDPWDLARMAEGVEAWGFRLMQERDQFLDRGTVARAWLEREYDPVIALLREADMLGSGAEADAYLRVAEQRYRLLRSHEWSAEIVASLRDAGV